MAPIRQICNRQLELLVEFAEANRSVVLANLGKGPLCQREANRAWEELALRLNSIGGGVSKTPTNWKRYWHVLKCRTKAKAADLRRSHLNTDGEPNKIIPLTDLERRIVSVIGKVAAEGIPEVRVPFELTVPQPSCSSSAPQQSTASASSNEMDLEFVAEEVKLEYPEPEMSSTDPTASALESSASAVEYSVGEVPDQRPKNPRGFYAAASSTQAQDSHRIFRPRRSRDDNSPRSAYELDERRVVAEERIADEIAGLGATNKEILGCLQQLVHLLQGHKTNNNI